jgi:hypothetical protein
MCISSPGGTTNSTATGTLVLSPRTGRDRHLLALAALGEAVAVIALVDLVQRIDRPLGQLQPRPERRAHLAAAASQAGATGRQLSGKAIHELAGPFGTCPGGEAARLC